MYPLQLADYIEIEGEGWPRPLLANEDLVRATMFTAMQSEYFEFRVTRPDRWEIRGNLLKDGWFIDRGHLDQRVSFRAVPLGDPRAGRALRWWHFWTKTGAHTFSLEEASHLIICFLHGDLKLEQVSWMTRTRSI